MTANVAAVRRCAATVRPLSRGGKKWRMLLCALATGVFFFLGGLFYGAVSRLGAAEEQRALLREVREAVLPEDARAALAVLEMRVGDTPGERLRLAEAYAVAALRLPEYSAFTEKALRELEFVLARGDFSLPRAMIAEAAPGRAELVEAAYGEVFRMFTPEKKGELWRWQAELRQRLTDGRTAGAARADNSGQGEKQ